MDYRPYMHNMTMADAPDEETKQTKYSTERRFALARRLTKHLPHLSPLVPEYWSTNEIC